MYGGVFYSNTGYAQQFITASNNDTSPYTKSIVLSSNNQRITLGAEPQTIKLNTRSTALILS